MIRPTREKKTIPPASPKISSSPRFSLASCQRSFEGWCRNAAISVPAINKGNYSKVNNSSRLVLPPYRLVAGTLRSVGSFCFTFTFAYDTYMYPSVSIPLDTTVHFTTFTLDTSLKRIADCIPYSNRSPCSPCSLHPHWQHLSDRG